MGDTVNLASRCTAVVSWLRNRASQPPIQPIEAREIDRVALVGQSQPQAIYEIMGPKGALTPQQIELCTRYNDPAVDQDCQVFG